MDWQRVLVTGGSGLLGKEIRKLLPDAHYPERSDFDVTSYDQMATYMTGRQFELMVHAAALTSPPRCDAQPLDALTINIVGTANVVRLCATNSLRLIYVSTDYVFCGDQGNYREEDPLKPVNKYAWSKLGGECCVRMYANSLLIRTSFGPNEFPYPAAFVDQWTSRQSVRQIAEKMVRLMATDLTGVIHVGGARRTVYEYAESLDPAKSIGQLSIKDVGFKVPVDTSLDCSVYEALIAKKA